MEFNEAFIKLIGHEGNFSDHPDDKGGATMFGITEAVARANLYYGDMRELSLFKAKAIYQQCYWNPVKADQLPAEVRFDVFDAAVNSGVGQSAKWLQRALGVDADGDIGPLTLRAANNADGGQLKAKFNGQRLQFMTNLPTWGSFGKGWARRIAKNLMED